ncbi:bifunctional riboflavin kinase/FAD synthetase [Croceiramulus getboli]|nr:bifunctional riboflavin kinase/FAD synthetase [Flavobacteriaceae bacterium YJPT1-3]
MEIYNTAKEFKPSSGTVVTIGTFDGVHLGHRKIMQRLIESGKTNGLSSLVLTFFPHPRMVLQQDSDIRLINTIEERKRLLEATGIDQLIVHPFTREFSRLSAESFVENILVNRLKARKVIIGYDHHFGRNRNANIDDLKRFGESFDFEVEEISKQDIDDVAISSTKIRRALEAGDIDLANTYLGYPFMLSGSVVEGKQIGRTIGYPTANLQIAEPYKLIPASGIYVVKAQVGEQSIYGMTSIGTNPTVGGTHQTIETFFFDFDQDLYQQPLQIELLTRIRDEQKFSSVSVLVAAMQRDEEFSRRFIQNYEAE